LVEGARNVTVAVVLPGAAWTPVGGPGTEAGVTLFEAADAAPVPAALIALTVKVYAVPFARPVITCDVEGEPALLSSPPPGLDVTV
jgi:hypothetical protein